MNLTHLAAAAAALLGLTAVGAAAQAPVWYGGFDPVPEGSYQRTCRDISAFGGKVYARCRDGRNQFMVSELDVRSCRNGRVENVNGRLRCEGYGGGGGYGGGPGGGGGYGGGPGGGGGYGGGPG
ncbi:MAG TPA: hypothetical protein VEA44_10140, partial [Caulobacter sp.]|nr:hypothetical protein [Caulobacter sp.]